MIKHFLLLAGLLFSMQVIAQTGIGTTTPNASAKLDVFSTTKGFLPPRVALTSTSSFSPITGLSDASSLLTAAGLLIYNTATAGTAPSNVTPGFYYWNGTSWIRLIVPTDNAANVTGTVAVANGGTGLSALGAGVATFLGTPTSANLESAVTGETGSGALVFGTSPSFTTPTLGAASATSLVVPTITGGSGTTQTLTFKPTSGNGVTGADHIFQVGNNGGTEAMRILNNGNIGIGTNAPVDRLDVRTAMSVNEIKFRGTDGGDDSDPYRLRKFKIGDLNELQLHLNDDWNERFAIYGNSCLNGACGEYSPNLYHYFRSDGDAYHAGRVGIGTTTPSASLHVASSVSNYMTTYGFLNINGAGSGTANNNANYSILANDRIRASEFNAVSDARIKRDINQLNTQKQLSELNKLNVVNYSYIDQLANGNKIKTGFIAQDLEKVNNQFVNQSNDFIPSIYSIAKSAILNNKLLQITTEKPHELSQGDQVKIFVEGKKEVIKIVEDVINPQSFIIKDWEESASNLFIYGKKVEDFRAIDFDQITALSVAAIQELSKQIDILKGENTNLKKSITEGIEARLLKLEAKMNQ